MLYMELADDLFEKSKQKQFTELSPEYQEQIKYLGDLFVNWDPHEFNDELAEKLQEEGYDVDEELVEEHLSRLRSGFRSGEITDSVFRVIADPVIDAQMEFMEEVTENPDVGDREGMVEALKSILQE